MIYRKCPGRIFFSLLQQVQKVVIEILYKSEADMKTIIEMGFKEGVAMAHDNLDELLAM